MARRQDVTKLQREEICVNSSLESEEIGAKNWKIVFDDLGLIFTTHEHIYFAFIRAPQLKNIN